VERETKFGESNQRSDRIVTKKNETKRRQDESSNGSSRRVHFL